MIVTITDLEAPELALYTQLNEVQLYHLYEPAGGAFIAESPVVIERALDAGCEPISVLAEGRHMEKDGAGKAVIERCGDVPVYLAETEILTKITGYTFTSGILCAMRRPKLLTANEVCENARRLVVLEDIMNPTNVGAIFRSAAALNMDGILLTSACTDPLYRRAIRVSMGTVFQIPWTVMDADWKIRELHEMGFLTVAMALQENALSIADPSLAEIPKMAIVLGTEGYGLTEETIAACHHTVKIPMSHGVDSLNVAAASAVAFWQLGSGK